MSYATAETSDYNGAPVFLYHFALGAQNWYFTNADATVNQGGVLYAPMPGIQHSDVSDDMMADNTYTKIKLPFDSDFARLILGNDIAETLYFIIYRGHLSTGDFVRYYAGYMSSYSVELPYFTVEGDRSFGNIIRPSATLGISSKCTVPLYGNQCKVQKSAHKEVVTMLARDGVTLTMGGLAHTTKNYYAGGYIEYFSGDNILSRLNIETSIDDVFVLDRRPVNLPVNSSVDVYPGCDHTWEGDCTNKFNNTINCPAFPFINSKNPFAGGRVF